MIVVDTSVWVDSFRGNNQKIVEALKDLLDRDQVALAAPIRIEILTGASDQERKVLSRLLKALAVLYPSKITWETIEEWIVKGILKGERFGAMDLVIAAIAAENKMKIWSLDRDFYRMEKLHWIHLFDL